MKKYSLRKFFGQVSKLFMALALMAGLNSCDNIIYDYGENCDPEPEAPAPDLKPGNVRIYVRTNPGSGGTSKVQEVNNKMNSAETEEGIYVSIDIEENGTYTLTATESNPDYKFVRWHDDTNDGDLTEGVKVISNIKAEATAKYTAVFEKIEDPLPEPEPGFVRIYVRSNPGSGGTSNVTEVANKNNAAETEEGIYVSIDVKENEAYTLTASETNPDYKFVRWHDDTNDGDLTEGVKVISNIKAAATARYTAVFEKIETPEPEPEPGMVKIYVRTNPGSGGTSKVHEDADLTNSAETQEGIYVGVELEENGTYTLTATETNPKYKFVRWHDDTNDGYLTEGMKVVSGLTAEVTTKYTAVFEKIETPEPEPEPGMVKIYVRTNPGSGGTSKVHEDADLTNSAETQEGIYVGIELEENGTYTLTATETNPEYKFVRWHDDTNDGSLTEGMKVVSGLTAGVTTKYTAVFEKIVVPDEPVEPELEGYYVKFVFERNMQFTDGFSQRVNSVDLYVFNTSGTFITKYHEDGVALKDPEYLMELTDLPAGEYEFIAWCGLTNNGGLFTVPSDAQINRDTQVICTMAVSSDTNASAYQNKNLPALFHGRTQKATYVEKTAKKQIQTVYLTKDTNNVNITLQHKDGLEFTKDRFVVTLIDKNDVLRHDNEIHPDATMVEYRPYRTVLGKTTSSRADAGSTMGNFMQVELSTSRLMANNNPIISVVDTESGKTIFSIPLVKWALQLRSSNYKSMDDQEYLDREDNYNLMLWLDSNKEDGWFGAEININDWHVIDDSMDIQ
ncbi:MAG: FimB/Mfa2 family fimbrial subunit [Muribaculaceae bacterium]|nr:FimB/Mfa2 family fimbrial subunit [Muribaculaceae bacterium]